MEYKSGKTVPCKQRSLTPASREVRLIYLLSDQSKRLSDKSKRFNKESEIHRNCILKTTLVMPVLLPYQDP